VGYVLLVLASLAPPWAEASCDGGDPAGAAAGVAVRYLGCGCGNPRCRCQVPGACRRREQPSGGGITSALFGGQHLR